MAIQLWLSSRTWLSYCMLYCSGTQAYAAVGDMKTLISDFPNRQTQEDFQSPVFCGSPFIKQWFNIFFSSQDQICLKRYPLQKATSHQRCAKLRFWGELLWLLPSVHINSVWHGVCRRDGESECARSVGCADERASNTHWQPVAWKLLAEAKAKTPSCLSLTLSVWLTLTVFHAFS